VSASADDGDGRREPPLQSLERALSVIGAFSAEHPSLTLSEVAKLTGLTPASARRVLLTLERLGYVRSRDRRFSLTVRVLSLGAGCLSAMTPVEVAYPLMQDLVRHLDEWCSMALLAPPDIVYVARVHSGHVLSIAGGVGSRLPAHATAAGRVLLAALDREELDDVLGHWPLRAYTARTLTDAGRFQAELAAVRAQGWALVDEELELGLRGIAAPVSGADGRTFAALSVSTTVARLELDELIERCLPPLIEVATTLSAALLRGAGAGSREAVQWPALAPAARP
jgi:IclR family pca regulon transcriptional regulator